MDDEAMKAMAQRIAWEQWPSSHDFPERDAAEAAAYAAIIETRDRDAALAWKMAGKQMPAYAVAEATRSGQQFRKDV